MKQKTINKLFTFLIVVLFIFVALLRVNEQRRVEYYICYDWYDNGYGMEEEEIEEFCKIRVYEGE